jgi:hypothetical protein
MRGNRRDRGVTVCVLLTLCLSAGVTAAQAPAAPSVPTLGCAEIETFLKTAKIGRPKSVPVGVTLPSKAPLDDGKMQHDVLIQTVDVSKASYQTGRGTELNFRDAWQFNVAGYELAKMLELNMVPPYVERTVSGVPASLSWWVNDTMMERERFEKKLTPPDVARWTAELSAARVFHELIADTDFNMTNLLITKDWRVWMIDFSRAFRLTKSLREPKNLTRVDRKLLANLRGLTLEGLQQRLGRWVNRPQIEAVLARRDLMVKFFDDEITAKKEATVLYDLARTSEPCGLGLQ